MSFNFYTEEEDNKKNESINNYKSLFLEYEKKLPTLEDALNQMFKSEKIDDIKINEFTKDLLDKCKQTIDKNYSKIKKKYNNISEKNAYIICAYTIESMEKKYSVYRILNKNLVTTDIQKGIENISKYLYLFLRALRKLPRYYPKKPNKYLYRFIPYKVSLSKDPFNENLVPYIVGNKKTFWGFISVSANPKTTYNSLKYEEKMKEGTIFSLGGDIWGYDIGLFNYFGEKEIILEPERTFIIDNVLPPFNEIIHITCVFLKSPLILNNIRIETNITTNNELDDDGEKDESIKYSEINKYIVELEMEMKINEDAKYKSGIGLLCSISSKHINILITYNHIIDFDFLNEMDKLIILMDNQEIEIDMKTNRYKYTDKELDITMIEILDEDNIYDFMEIDKFIYSKNYLERNIISISINEEKKMEILNGKIKSKKRDNYICSVESKSEGIIILKENLKLIGIIKENEDKKETEIIPMNIIINKINYIKCKYYIKKNDLRKNIQIMNNYDFDYDCFIEERQKEINVIINGKIKSNIFTYIFHKEGIYTIYLICHNLLKNMSFMFYNCYTLKEINFSSFNTNWVVKMSWMFYNCSLLKEIDLSSFNTNHLTDISGMFWGCKSLKQLNISSFSTNLFTNISGMFYKCNLLNEIECGDQRILNEFNEDTNCIII